ncbi:MAG TPA: DNA alkylation repair protein [Methanospirillum sp.]|nr:DNA alkylation repair protein [Methanospirillum sp.]
MDPIIQRIRDDLIEMSDETSRISSQRFFKEKVLFHGVKSAGVGKIAKKYWNEVKKLDKPAIFALCEELYTSGYCEEAFLVSSWVPNLSDQYTPEDIAIFRHWINSYITNWAMCDGFCNHSVGLFIERYPEYIEELMTWTQSENRWMRRAAAVSLIVPAKHGKFLNEAFKIADLLMNDTDDMVQKGYGWLLKEASRHHQDEVFAYVLRHKKVMPRTSLRYAIELMPKEIRAEAMKKT